MCFSDSLWSERKKAVLKIRAKVIDLARSWFKRYDYIEVQGPIIIPAVGEWTNYFEVKYFDRKAYLAHGLQIYAEVLAANLGKIFTISPVFRTEYEATDRHLTEYWHIEAQIPHGELNDVLKVQEELVSHVCLGLCRESREELNVVQRDVKDLMRVEPPFPRLTYDDAIEILQANGSDIQWGRILDWENEQHLSLLFSQPFFVTEFPVGTDTFFYQPHFDRSEVTLSADLFAPEGYGEISSGGQPIVEREELLKKMGEEKINLEEQKWFIDLKNMGSVPYSGFAIGVERLTQWICKLEHIREASAFPRLMDNIYP